MRSPTLSAFPTLSPIRHFRFCSAQSRPRCNAWTLEERSFSALCLFANQLLDQLGVEIEQRAERAEIDDVLEQLPLARIGIGRIGDRSQRDADHRDVGAEFRRRHRLGGIVEQIAAGLDRGDVLVPGLRVHRHHHVDAATGTEMTARVIRTSYQVGSPWMLRKMLRGDTGTPCRRIERANNSLARSPSPNR